MSVSYRLNKKRNSLTFAGIFLFVSIISSSLFISSYPVYAAPGKINYQGRLTDVTGVAKPDGQYNMKFRIYDALSAGTVIWSEVRETTNRVTVTNGQFNVQLGDVTLIPTSAFISNTTYFEVELPTPATANCSTAACGVYTEGAMTPRQPVASSAYAMNSDTLDSIDSTSFARSDVANTLTGPNLFKNTSNSTAAFGVQTATSVSLMNVDTTASKVTIGTNGAGAAITTLSSGNVGIGNPVPGSTLDVAGNALFKNATDTTTAFQVQSSTAATLFIVDTLNSQVKIGSPTADAIGVVLILDIKNTAGDPTGVAGAMYYNSNLRKFRCFEYVAWINCGPSVYRVASDVNSTSTAGFLSNITGLTFVVDANIVYNFRATINYTTPLTTTGARWAITGPTLGALSMVTRSPLTTSTEWVQYINAYGTGTISASSAFTTGNVATMEGTVMATAGGSVNLQFATEVTNSAITVKAGSTVTVW